MTRRAPQLLPVLSVLVVLGCTNSGPRAESTPHRPEATLIWGFVLSAADSLPVSHAAVFIPALKVGTRSNLQGKFAIRGVSLGSYALRVQRTCYGAGDFQIEVSADGVEVDPIYLRYVGGTLCPRREAG